MSSQRILGHMVTRNEADRYLGASLRWLRQFTDGVAVFDDRSTDDTVAIAEDLGCVVAVRDVDVPAFLQDESACRHAGWEHLTRALEPTPDDWVLCVDADEFLVAAVDADERAVLLDVIARAFDYRNDAVSFPKPEVFGFDHDGTPLVRTDGWWPKIVETRLVRWQPGGEFRPAKLAGGSVPSYGDNRCQDDRLWTLHFGYARRSDQIDKHARYTTLPGHSNRHVQSILTKPTLARWPGKTPGITGVDG